MRLAVWFSVASISFLFLWSSVIEATITSRNTIPLGSYAGHHCHGQVGARPERIERFLEIQIHDRVEIRYLASDATQE
jgi:hypothetical protein